MAAYQPDGRNRVIRRQTDAARRLAVEGRWDDAISLNQQILESTPRDVSAMNRLGNALKELGRFHEALETYKAAAEIDASNAIAQRNIARLEQVLASGLEIGTPPAPIRANVFIEEVGKTYITELQSPGSPQVLARLAPADQLEIRLEGSRIVIYDLAGDPVGQLEPEIAQLLARLIETGNRYEAFVVALSGNTARVILREIFRNPDSTLPLAFPRQATIAAPRPYLRDSRRLAGELEPELLLDSDEEDEDEESEEEDVDEIDAEGRESEEEDEYVDEAENEDAAESSPLSS